MTVFYFTAWLVVIPKGGKTFLLFRICKLLTKISESFYSCGWKVSFFYFSGSEVLSWTLLFLGLENSICWNIWKAFFWENIWSFLILELGSSIFSEYKKFSRCGFSFTFRALTEKCEVSQNIINFFKVVYSWKKIRNFYREKFWGLRPESPLFSPIIDYWFYTKNCKYSRYPRCPCHLRHPLHLTAFNFVIYKDCDNGLKFIFPKIIINLRAQDFICFLVYKHLTIHYYAFLESASKRSFCILKDPQSHASFEVHRSILNI